MKVNICGASGVGKTTLAKWIADEYKVPFIVNSAKPLWDKHNIKGHLDLIRKCNDNPQFGIDFQYELLEMRRENTKGLESFVTDRSPIDNVVYFLMQVSTYVNENECENYIKSAIEILNEHEDNFLVYLPFTNTIVDNDGARITNKFFQHTVDAVFSYMYDNYVINKIVHSESIKLDKWDFEERKKIMIEFLKGKQG
jgi:deoxyadenosine/deoxycytidine kinase